MSEKDPSSQRKSQEDSLHVGGTRQPRLFGIPMPIAIVLMSGAYIIQTNITGWRGVGWAAATTVPLWMIVAMVVANDPYGVNVVISWVRTCLPLRDKRQYGGPSLSPLPNRQNAKRGMFRV